MEIWTMLILGRRSGEKVMIGNDIVISVLGVHGNQIRLGFEAPEGVIIHRQEIYEKIKDKEDKNTKS
jgi:carbon storage regulator